MKIATFFVGILAILTAAAWAQPPRGNGTRGVLWSEVGGFPTPKPAPLSARELRKQQRDRASYEHFMSERRQAEARAATPPAKGPPPPAPPPAPPSATQEMAAGFLWAGGILFGGGFLFFGIFWFVHKASGMGSGGLTPHQVESPGPLDRDKVRKFVNSPSPPPLDLGVSNASQWNTDTDWDSGYSDRIQD